MNLAEWSAHYVRIGRDRDVLTKCLSGISFAEIGREYGISREYIRQIINRILKYKPTLDEDMLPGLYWYKTYGFLKYPPLKGVFGISEQTFYYWRLVYSRNHQTTWKDMLSDPLLGELRNPFIEQFPKSAEYRALHLHEQLMHKYKDVFDSNPHDHLTVKDIYREPSTRCIYFICECSCGKTVRVARQNLSRTHSCGCFKIKHDWTPTRAVRNVQTGEVFESIRDANNKYNIAKGSISAACAGRSKTAGGYAWEYVEDPQRLKVRCVETGEIFPNATKAGKAYGTSGVWQALKGIAHTAGGYHWEYVKQ